MLAQDDQHSDTQERSEIIEDLLKNKPSGPAHFTVTYQSIEEWCPKKGIPVVRAKPSHPHYGYDAKTLFNLGMRSLDDVRKILRRVKFDGKYVIGGKKRVYTRQCNRLWKRIEPAVKTVIQNGGVGVYRVIHKSVRTSYTLRETNIGFVYAVDYKEATNMARLLFGYLVKDPENIETVFARFGDKKSLLAYNTRAIKKIDDRINELTSSLEYTKKRIKKLETMKGAVTNVTISMCVPQDDIKDEPAEG